MLKTKAAIRSCFPALVGGRRKGETGFQIFDGDLRKASIFGTSTMLTKEDLESKPAV